MAAVCRSMGYWLVFLLWTLTCAGQDQPLNIFVGDLTFVRPKNWRWESPPGDSPADSRYVISPVGSKQTTDCRFYLTKDTPQKAVKRWKTHFSFRGNSFESDEQTVKTKAGNLTLYVIDGSYANTSHQTPQSNFRLIGAMIPSGKEFVRIRFLGPRADVDKATPVFKKMVIDALEQRATNQ